MKNILYVFLIGSLLFSSCKNEDWEFDDFEYQTVYFANQYPVRTITLGEDIYDNSLDNEWKFQIMATTGGVYKSGEVTIDIEVDNSLLTGLEFSGSGAPLLPLPDEYYALASDKIVIPAGSVIGGVEVQLTGSFFADPLAIQNTYVIPVVMTNVSNADSILSGVSNAESASRVVPGEWAVQPKDFVLYAVKYINPWHGYYLRRGTDVISGKNGNTELDETVIRRQEFAENDQVKQLTTHSLQEVQLPLTFQDTEGNDINCTIILTFDDEGNCTITSGSEDYTATGSGKFVKNGEVKSWGNKDRDALYLNYEIDLDELHVSTVDTLVMRNRGVAMELFTPSVQ